MPYDLKNTNKKVKMKNKMHRTWRNSQNDFIYQGRN